MKYILFKNVCKAHESVTGKTSCSPCDFYFFIAFKKVSRIKIIYVSDDSLLPVVLSDVQP